MSRNLIGGFDLLYSRCSVRLPEDYATRYQLVICFCTFLCCLLIPTALVVAVEMAAVGAVKCSSSSWVAGVETVD